VNIRDYEGGRTQVLYALAARTLRRFPRNVPPRVPAVASSGLGGFDGDAIPRPHWVLVSDVPCVIAGVAFVPKGATVRFDFKTSSKPVAGALRALGSEC
jgi:hypothetical protein